MVTTPTTPPWRSYVAMGDSFTEGLWDVLDSDGVPSPDLSTWATANPHDPDVPTLRLRGWADLLAQHLARRRQEPLSYANLAIRGKLLGPIVEEQLEPAIALRPDLVSFVGGGNDILRASVDIDSISAQLEEAVVRLRAEGIDVLLATGFDMKSHSMLSATRSRVALFNANISSIARRHGAYVLDLWGMRSLRDPECWSEDRIHLLAKGHERVAQAALAGLGLAADDPAWDDAEIDLPQLPVREQLAHNAAWVRHHAYPWATRRFRGTSSEVERLPKFPEYVEVVDGDPPD
ncbi:SGNH/GDSL hydrolase family protein [Salana multivorans]|uniref:SGNH/GDSL hydrolase family protein n=1 Tax=Salana multivorans TaxID=120377 RepID=UPI000959E9B6|nr:SGNH/GDSL hydrolase family protein [Salana multivorans]MBN8883573.1 SGNH/GDSL hydrolase family protein [Salana multivorans]OJX93924.1 MAG: G-D-S-L family lipolytic protein [Micrococcales bacterium 73-15]